MTKTEHFPATVEARPHGNRAHSRRKLSPMAYVELGQDNGGILLNLSEGGFAVQSALALTTREFSELRFQVPAVRGWLTASGRIAWISDSKKEAGIQFTELPGKALVEIQRWVSAEGSPEDRSTERASVGGTTRPAARPHPAAAAAPEHPGLGMEILDAPYRASERINEAPIAQNPRTSVGRTEPARTSSVEPVGVATAEPQPQQDFHFTDYSMFAAAPERDGVWAQPARSKGGWRAAVLGIMVAGLFFALGATVGRGTVDQWVAYLGGWVQGKPTPALRVMPPSPPEQLAATKSENDKSDTTGKGTADNQARAEDSENAKPDAARTESSEAAGASKSEAGPDGGKGDSSQTGPPRGTSEGDAAARSANSGSVERRTKRSVDAIPREDSYTKSEPRKTANEHSILVNAPEPGSSPFFVNLPTEAVSASGAVAMSARRTLEILPRNPGAPTGAERVVVGKLIAHSEPFYPVDARSRGIEGSVELRARVGRTGQVVGVTPISGPGLLFPAAVAAVREWRYEPTYVNGDPAETLADITIVFRLQ